MFGPHVVVIAIVQCACTSPRLFPCKLVGNFAASPSYTHEAHQTLAQVKNNGANPNMDDSTLSRVWYNKHQAYSYSSPEASIKQHKVCMHDAITCYHPLRGLHRDRPPPPGLLEAHSEDAARSRQNLRCRSPPKLHRLPTTNYLPGFALHASLTRLPPCLPLSNASHAP